VTAADDPGRGLLPRGIPHRALHLPSAPFGADTQTAPMTEQQFQLVYDATSGPILGYLVAVTNRRDVAEDLLQETYTRFLSHHRALLDPTDTRRYLFRIATNLLRDRWRKGDATPYPDPPEPSHTTDLDISIDVRAALQSLKPRERELLWLAYVDGMSHNEIAAATGLQSLSVRLLLYRARKKAAALLSPGRPTP
jgi:RNA polymerase sigma-70 factor (ECF subfamily)